MGMLEQSRTTPRNPIVPSRQNKHNKKKHNSRPSTASDNVSDIIFYHHSKSVFTLTLMVLFSTLTH